LAVLALASLPLLAFGPTRWGPAIPFGLLALAQIPITVRLVRHAGRARYLLFAVMSFLRAFWRGVGMTMGVLAVLGHRRERAGPPGAAGKSAPS